MAKNRATLFRRIVSILLYGFSIVIIPVLIGFSYLLREKIEVAYKEHGQNETIKLINMWGLFGLLSIVFRRRNKKIEI